MHTILITPTAAKDIASAMDYNNSKAGGLDERLQNEVDGILMRIAELPMSFTIRYRNIRAAKVPTYPYLLFYKINEQNKYIEVMRVFNTHQQPFWI